MRLRFILKTGKYIWVFFVFIILHNEFFVIYLSFFIFYIINLGNFNNPKKFFYDSFLFFKINFDWRITHFKVFQFFESFWWYISIKVNFIFNLIRFNYLIFICFNFFYLKTILYKLNFIFQINFNLLDIYFTLFKYFNSLLYLRNSFNIWILKIMLNVRINSRFINFLKLFGIFEFF